MKQIITSLMDVDLYKATMMQCVYHQFPDTPVEFEFKCRTKGINLFPYEQEIRNQIDSLGNLKFTDNELRYIGGLRYIKKDFIDFLRILRIDPSCVKIYKDGDDFGINISGSWLYTMWFETMILAIISEVWNKEHYNIDKAALMGLEKLDRNLDLILNQTNLTDKPFRLIEFGTRRRFSKEYHKKVIEMLMNKTPQQLMGTSNIRFAMDFGLRPVGTHAHEFFEAMQGMNCKLIDSQKFALDAWVSEYRGDLGIALTDTIGIDAFLRDFDMYFAKLFDGCRQDSGCPYEFTQKMIAHYRSLGINPAEKAIVYSDSLDIPKAIDLWKTFEGTVKTSFGIGTKLTNDIPGVTPLNIVIKMTKCNGKPVAKVSVPEKTMCKDTEYLAYIKKVFGVR